MKSVILRCFASCLIATASACAQSGTRELNRNSVAMPTEKTAPSLREPAAAAAPGRVMVAAHEEPSRVPADTSVAGSPLGRKLTLGDLEQMALQGNPTLAQAAAGVEQERGSYEQVGLYPNPQLGYINNSASPSSVQQSNGAFISQEFVTANKLKLARAWEGHELNRVGWEAEAQRMRVLNDLKLRFHEVLGAQEAVEETQKLEKLAEKGLATAENLVEGKQGARTDVLQATIQLETVRINKEDALSRHRAAWQQLANIVGDPEMRPSLLEGRLDGEIPELDFEQSWEELAANSPQLVSSQAALDHARAEWQLACAQAIPNVTVQAVIQRDNATQSTQASTLVALPVPLFNRNQGNIHRAMSGVQAAEAEIARVRLVLRDLLSESFRRYQTSKVQVHRFRETILPNAEENVELASLAYQSGERSYLELLTAQQTLFHAKLTYVEALTELRKAQVEIEGLQLTGGLNPSAIGTAIQAQPGGGASRQRALLNQVQEGASRQLLPAAQLGR